MATYSWKRYNLIQQPKWSARSSGSTIKFGQDPSDAFYKAIYWNAPWWFVTGGKWAFGETVNVGDEAYDYSGNEEDNMRKFVATQSGSSSNTIICDMYTAYRGEYTQAKGTSYTTVTSTGRNTYPDNGISGSYWYVYDGVVNTAPTTPGQFTSPVVGAILKGGETLEVRWGASSDVDGNLTGYELSPSFDNGVTYGAVYHPGSNSQYVPIPAGVTQVKFRVLAKDSNIAKSAYRYSDNFIVSNNAVPNLTLNTPDNKTLSESVGQNELLVEGTAKDTDANNNVMVRAQINDGTVRNLASALSDGSTPIPFSRLLTYSDQQIFDGDTPISNALSEGVDHKLKVWAEDGQGGISAITERKFRVIHNRPPVISDTDRDLGNLIHSTAITYHVHDLEEHAIKVTEKIDGKVIRTFDAVAHEDNTLEIPLEMWIPLAIQQHSLTVEATDSAGLKSVRTYTFTRDEDTILLELKNPFVTDIAATRILVTPEVYVPIGASIIIEACNNAFDDEPTWEDITSMAMAKRGFSFINTTKTAEQWGINIRFTLNKGTATQQVRLDGFGGAFE